MSSPRLRAVEELLATHYPPDRPGAAVRIALAQVA